MEDGYHNIHQIIQAAGRGKTTFLRWEREGKIPRAHRDHRGWRYYTDQEYKYILSLIRAQDRRRDTYQGKASGSSRSQWSRHNARRRSFFARLRSLFFIFALSLIVGAAALLFAVRFAQSAGGVPRIMSYQGRLSNASGSLLGGSGTTFYFRFSLHSASSGGSQLWPASTPCTHSLTVKDGVFNAGIGDTSECADVLDFDFTSRDAVYLEIRVSSDNSTFETLTPRHRINTSAFALVADTLIATSTQSRLGTTSPIGTSLLTIEATTTSVIPLSIRGASGQSADLLQIQDSAGTDLVTVTGGGLFGIGTTSPGTTFSVVGSMLISGSATSTLYGGLNVATNGLRISTVTGCNTANALATDASGNIICDADDSGGGGTINSGNSNRLTYYSGATTLDSANFLAIDTSNNLFGVGTSSPWARLSVAGALGMSGRPLFTVASSTGSNATTTFVHLTAGGLFGLMGTTSPGAVLSITGTSTAPVFLVSTSSPTVTAQTAFLITSGGLVGLGTTTPYTDLSVRGTGAFDILNINRAGATSTSLAGFSALGTAGLSSINGLTLTGGSFLNTSSATSTFTGSGLSVAGGGLSSSQGLTITGGNILSTVSGTSTALTGALSSAGLSSSNGITLSGGSMVLANLTGCDTIDTTSTGALVCGTDGGGGGTINSGVTNALTYYSGATTLDSANFLGINNATGQGFLGIGTSTPWGRLSVAGASTLPTNNPLFTVASTTGPNPGATSTLLILLPSGNFGLGTSSPAATLSLTGTSTAPVFLVSTSSPTVTAQTAFLITSGGLVGLGTTTPYTDLSVRGTGAFDILNINRAGATSTSLAGFSALGTAGLSSINGLTLTGGSFLNTSSATSTFTGSGLSVAGGGLSSSQGLTITGGNILYSTPRFVIQSTGELGIGTTSPSNRLSVGGDTYLDSNLITLASSSAATLTISYQRAATSTIPGTTINAWSIATSTTVMPILSVHTFAGTGIASTTVPGRIGIGTTTPEARLSIQGTTAAHLGIAGIHEILTMNSETGGTHFGNRLIAYNSPTQSANTFVAQFVRILDDSGLANTARGIEIQSGSGTTTVGVNTGIFSLAKTFGVQGITTGTAAGTLIPAGIFAETRSPTEGQALRVYTSTTTTADLSLFYQEGTQNFQGSGLKMNFGKGTGAFQGSFLNLQVNDVTRIIATTTGSIAIGTSTPFYATSSASNVATHRGIQIHSGAMMVGKQFPMLLLQTDSTESAGNTWFITAQDDVDVNAAADFKFGVDTAGTVYAESGTITNPVDYAEFFPAADAAGLGSGDLVMVDGSALSRLVRKSEGVPYDARVLGIVSTKPGFVTGYDMDGENEEGVVVALAGRVPVKISDEGGPVRPGDRLTSSSIPGVAMKATTSGMTIGVALEAFDGTHYLSEGTIGVETNQFTEEGIAKVIKKLFKPPLSNYGGEEVDARPEEVAIEETVTTSTTTVKVPEQRSAQESSTASGQTVKIGKVLTFVNLTWVKLDSAVPQLASGAIGPANAWAVDQQSGKVNVSFFGNINMQGNAILDVGRITGYLGKWSIDESGSIVVEEIRARRGTFEESLEVGTQAKPTGITIYDDASGQPYCIRVTQGIVQSIEGRCAMNPAPISAPSVEDTPAPDGADEIPSQTPTEPEAAPPPTSDGTSSGGEGGGEVPAP